MAATTSDAQREHCSAKPPMFDGEKFEYWKDRIESFFLGFDADLWDHITDGYTRPIDEDGVKIPRDKMTEAQKKMYKDHHRARTILLSVIPYEEYEKITDCDSAKAIFDSLKIFQMIISGIRILDKGYTNADHVKRILRGLPEKWMPLMTSLKLSKDIKKMSLEELIGILRSHEIDRADHVAQRKQKSIALKVKSEKTKALQVEQVSEESSEDSDEDELSLLSKRINHLWKHRQNKYKSSSRAKGKQESSSGQQSEGVDSDGEVVEGLMAIVKDKEAESKAESDPTLEVESDSGDESEVFASFSLSELKSALAEIMNKHDLLMTKHKRLKNDFLDASDISAKHVKTISELKENNFSLVNSNSVLKNEISKLEEVILSSTSDDKNEIKCEKSFQRFLAKSVDRSLMASMIYDVSRNRMNEEDKDSEDTNSEVNASEEAATTSEPSREKKSRVIASHPEELIMGDKDEPVRTRSAFKPSEESLLSLKGLVSLIEPTSIDQALQDEGWVLAMKEELNQFTKNDVWNLVKSPKDTHIIGTKSEDVEGTRATRRELQYSSLKAMLLVDKIRFGIYTLLGAVFVFHSCRSWQLEALVLLLLHVINV
ncbi:uncharacterized protein LOC130725251 [Lotus japonicus]|uniref:uncharacterized protein LOC130725251 n=1 Tax=Lotus japonicus TaxID=34305 RepID=UPI00258B9082|nr:uncharacterized protein LOC130725251 [Lotus japonicus]